MKVVLPALIESTNSNSDSNSRYSFQYGLNLNIQTMEDLEPLRELLKGVLFNTPLELYALTSNGTEQELVLQDGIINTVYLRRSYAYKIKDDQQKVLDCELFDFKEIIPEEYQKLFPKRVENINRNLNKHFCFHKSYGVDDFSWYLVFWGKKLVSIVNGCPTVIEGSVTPNSENLSYYVTATPECDIPQDLLYNFVVNKNFGRNIPPFSTKGSNRIVISNNYLRYNSNEFYNYDYNHLLQFTLVNGTLSYPSKANKLKIFDSQLMRLLQDDKDTWDIPCHLDVNLNSKYLPASSNSAVHGVHINEEEFETDFCSFSPYYKFKLTEEEVMNFRESLNNSDDVYSLNKVLVNVTKHLAKKNQTIQLTSIADGKLCVLTKTAAKQKTEESSYKTRVYNNIHSHFMSICYVVTLHNDLVCPEGYYNGIYGFSDFVREYRYVACDRYSRQELAQKNYTCTFDETYKRSLADRITQFVKLHAAKGVVTSTIGSPSVITKYFIRPDVNVRYSTNYSCMWLYGLDRCDVRNYGWNNIHPSSFPRALSYGFNADTQSISSNYFLHLLREKDVPHQDWVFPSVYKSRSYLTKIGEEELNRKRRYRQAMSEFYSSNCIPNIEIENDLSRRLNDLDIRTYEYNNNHIKYNEIITLSDESIAILSEGYKCDNYTSLFAWWANVYPILVNKVKTDTKLSETDVSFAMFMLEANDFIISNLTNNIDELT